MDLEDHIDRERLGRLRDEVFEHVQTNLDTPAMRDRTNALLKFGYAPFVPYAPTNPSDPKLEGSDYPL